jgi:hypothetical protein
MSVVLRGRRGEDDSRTDAAVPRVVPARIRDVDVTGPARQPPTSVPT